MRILSTVKYRIRLALRRLARPLRPLVMWHHRIRNYEEQLARSSPRYRSAGAGYAEKDFPDKKDEIACKVVAFYLPQFHRFDVNDRAWGYGFTDWENVARAMPVCRGHYQPRLAGEFGYYDLNNAELHGKQVEVAREAGLHAFCYHHYWFDPHVLMDTPVERHMRDLHFPFMLCWANETWSKRWDGSESEVIMSQDYKPGSAERAGRYFSRYFQSSKYVRIDGRPVFIIYRTDKVPDLDEFVARFSDAVEQAIGARPYMVNALTFASPLADGKAFQKSVYFPPHGFGTDLRPVYTPERKPWSFPLLREFGGTIYRYEDLGLQQAAAYENTGTAAFPTVCPGWDNTARKPNDGNIFLGDTPQLFERWIQRAATHLRLHFPPGERILFVNAWNEWAEGAYLEPDRVRGYAHLNVLSKFCGTSG
jgi:lipopolysaccharide biosynthesis protein